MNELNLFYSLDIKKDLSTGRHDVHMNVPHVPHTCKINMQHVFLVYMYHISLGPNTINDSLYTNS